MKFSPPLLALQTRFNHCLQQIIQQSEMSEEFREVIAYSCLSGGKRIRPLLVYCVGDALKISVDICDTVAAAIECIHCYSLIHDDLPAMDNAELRRGQPTCHKKFNEASAILAGDALIPFAFELLSTQKKIAAEARIKMMSELAQAIGVNGMVAGQVYDCDPNWQPNKISDIQQLHQLKTGCLFACCLLLPAYAAEITDTHILQQFKKIGLSLGLIFQIQDDLLDAVSTSTTTGKDFQKDQQLQKNTFISYCGIEKTQQMLNEEILKLKKLLAELPYQAELLKSLVESLLKRNY